MIRRPEKKTTTNRPQYYTVTWANTIHTYIQMIPSYLIVTAAMVRIVVVIMYVTMTMTMTMMMLCVCVLLCSAAMVSWVLTTRPATKSSALSGAPSNPTTSNTTKQSGGGDVYNTAYHAQRYWYMLCASCCRRCVCVCVPVCASFCVVALRHQQ